MMIKSAQKVINKEVSQYRKFLKQYMHYNFKFLAFFIIDVVLFVTVIIAFFINTFDVKMGAIIAKIFKYYILSGSLYILLKFTITNFFYKSIYYKKIIVFDKQVVVKQFNFGISKQVELASLRFLTLFIFMNVIIAVILNYEYDVLFANETIICAFVMTLINILLVPSFVFSLNNIFTIKERTNYNYKSLIRNQYYANISLLKNYEVVNNWEYITFQGLDLKTKKGTFLLTKYEDKTINDRLKTENEKIIVIYATIWKKYCQYLSYINSINVDRTTKYLNLYIERMFDAIFIDFLDI